jgi:hypothetical protein
MGLMLPVSVSRRDFSRHPCTPSVQSHHHSGHTAAALHPLPTPPSPHRRNPPTTSACSPIHSVSPTDIPSRVQSLPSTPPLPVSLSTHTLDSVIFRPPTISCSELRFSTRAAGLLNRVGVGVAHTAFVLPCGSADVKFSFQAVWRKSVD